VYVDIRGRDLRSVVHDMQRAVGEQVTLPPGYSVAWSGQFEYLERAQKRLALVVPAMLMIIFVMLYLTFRRMDEALLIMATLPFSLVGGVWLLHALGHEVSVATAVGFIGLAGVTAEFGIVMLVYLKMAWEARVAEGRVSVADLVDAVREGAVLRVRPKAMTVATTVIGLAPILWDTGTGSEIMSRIAAPMIGGMVTAPLISMFVVPAAWLLMRRREARRLERAAAPPSLQPQPQGAD
jgi:Cu(I)/Ag(I) efflux system membrane protein CusA/SilA